MGDNLELEALTWYWYRLVCEMASTGVSVGFFRFGTHPYLQSSDTNSVSKYVLGLMRQSGKSSGLIRPSLNHGGGDPQLY